MNLSKETLRDYYFFYYSRHVELTDSRIHGCRHFRKKYAVEETQFIRCLLRFAKGNEIISEVAFLSTFYFYMRHSWFIHPKCCRYLVYRVTELKLMHSYNHEPLLELSYCKKQQKKSKPRNLFEEWYQIGPQGQSDLDFAI